MYKSLKISQLRRKRIAAILLLNFLFSTVLFSFPQSKCDGMCSIEIELHACSDTVEMTEMTCCDKMDMNNTNSIPCEMEITDNSCDYTVEAIDNFTFLVPKSLDTKIVLIEIAKINLNIVEKISDAFILSQNIIPDVSPPIYLANSSFLI